MTTIYWAAAVVALISAVAAAVEWVRDRSPVLAAWALSMATVSASLADMAAVPAVMKDGSEAAASVCAAMGIVGTWAFAEVLATATSDERSVADLVTTPLLGGACALLLLLGLNWAHGIGHAELARLTAIAGELTVAAYYVPGLGRIAVLAHQRARSIPARWTRMTMRMVCTAACAELVLLMVRSAVLVGQAWGLEAGEPAIPVITALQGLAMICGVSGLAAGPVIMAVSRRCAAWFGSWS